MKRTVVYVLVSLSCLTSLASASDLPLPANKEETPVEGAAVYKAADTQQAIDVPEKGFSIVSPTSWTYATNFPGATLVLQAPEADDPQYRRSISVTSYNESKEITDANVADFQKWLVTAFSQGDSSISGYQVRNHLAVDLDSGLKGHLFYTEFTVNSVEMMQMHVLISAEDRHFIVSYTDLATYFDVSEKPSEHLNEAWQAINTVSLKDPIVPPMKKFLEYAIFGVIALGLLIGGTIIQRRRQRKNFEALDQQVKPEDDSKPLTHSPESITPISLSVVKIRDEVATYEDDDQIKDNKEIDFDQERDTLKRVS